MINHTKAYERLRQQAENLFDFTVAVCYAMPSLKRQINNIEKGKKGSSLPRPDYFLYDRSTPQEVRERTINYKSKLSSYILLSIFSFFEAYVTGATREIVDFHGGDHEFLSLAERRCKKFLSLPSGKTKAHKRKLQEPIKPKKHQKYKKHSKALTEVGYRFPTELLSAYGVRMLVEKTRQRAWAREIPEILREALHMELDDQTEKKFHSIRDMRNRIAHGKKARLSIKKVMEMNRFLRELSVKIDKHIVEHFMVIEKYA